MEMEGFVAHDLAATVEIRLVADIPALPAALDKEIDRIWQIATAHAAAGGAGSLFNGRVFSADVIAPGRVSGHMTEFRQIVAQMQRPDLFPALRVRPLAVCGVLRCAGGVVVGRRHPDAVYQPGQWQLPPAGSVDEHALHADGQIDPVRQIHTELAEELGIEAAEVDTPHPLCIVEHPGSHVCDLGMAMTTKLPGEEVLARHRQSGNDEYDPLLVVAEVKLAAYLATLGPALVPPAPIFLARAGILAVGIEEH